VTSLTMALGTGLLVALSCGLIIGGLLKQLSSETPKQRLVRLSAARHPMEQAELEGPFLDRVLKPWLLKQLHGAGRLAPSYNIEQLRLNLQRAGRPYGLTILDFYGIKLLVALSAAGSALYLLSLRQAQSLSSALLAVATGVLGFLAPDFWLGSLVRRRQVQIRRSLPDALDMLTICVDAGAGLDSGMLKISEKWHNAIATEFGKVVAEIRIGLSRREALENLVSRTNVSEVRSFVAVLVQAEQFGLSIASVLHTQSEQMRIRRWQRAEEEARKVPIKLLFPLIFLIFPALLAVTLGPAIPAVLITLSQIAK
jgi:tight adherence protein C